MNDPIRDGVAAIREEKAVEREHRHDARVFLTEHTESGLAAADHFRKELAAEIEAGQITPESAGTQLEEEIIEEVFEAQGADYR
jgi:hypothetical protein